VSAPSYTLPGNTQLAMSIACGAAFTEPFWVYRSDAVTPLPVDEPVIEMRRDTNPDSQLLARLDVTGTADGLIQIIAVGQWLLHLAASVTALMPSGRGFWDCFGLVDGDTAKIASGVLTVTPRVTAWPPLPAGEIPPGPPEPTEPPQTVEAEPAIVNIRFRGGDDYFLDLTLTDQDTGAPADLSGDMVAADVFHGGQQLGVFTVLSVNVNVIHLMLDHTITVTLPPVCRWECRLSLPEGIVTIAVGDVTVTS
jgi:hypothetical protein